MIRIKTFLHNTLSKFRQSRNININMIKFWMYSVSINVYEYNNIIMMNNRKPTVDQQSIENGIILIFIIRPPHEKLVF